jgi:hypothetical protein
VAVAAILSLAARWTEQSRPTQPQKWRC